MQLVPVTQSYNASWSVLFSIDMLCTGVSGHRADRVGSNDVVCLTDSTTRAGQDSVAVGQCSQGQLGASVPVAASPRPELQQQL